MLIKARGSSSIASIWMTGRTEDSGTSPARRGVAVLASMSPARRKEAFWFYLCIAPWLIGFLVFQLGPMIASFVFSFTRYNISQPMVFVGLANYIRALSGQDILFWHALKITATYAVVTVPLRLGLGFGLGCNFCCVYMKTATRIGSRLNDVSSHPKKGTRSGDENV